jgi:hypothetical protein
VLLQLLPPLLLLLLLLLTVLFQLCRLVHLPQRPGPHSCAFWDRAMEPLGEWTVDRVWGGQLSNFKQKQPCVAIIPVFPVFFVCFQTCRSRRADLIFVPLNGGWGPRQSYVPDSLALKTCGIRRVKFIVRTLHSWSFQSISKSAICSYF